MARVQVYERAGCHLCELARPVIDGVCAEFDEVAVYIDIDITRDEITDSVRDLIPCVFVDGVRSGFWRIDPAELRAALAR